ncbi:hypothetical protein C2845_PM16G00180 [Panicum miliaceum]|uniref:Aminotransferase-like plant mobile domain-containing protein n=1 Tax=Panicum miliaceum TaxID=4540 RepID=A0A3L6PX92_PANMI|nr:hypothetical protein C2845_PM16G00180 [Panicum miliaceum]
MPASTGHPLYDYDPKPPAFLTLPLPPRTPTPPPPPPPSSPPPAVPPLFFRYLTACPRWSSWVAAALRDPSFTPALASSDISDAVAASTAAIAPDRAALSALLSFWDSGTHTFRLPAGPATFTLEDALVLAGLPPTGAPLYRPLAPEEEDLRVRLVVEREKIRELHPCARAARRVSLEVWLEWFHGSGIRPGEDDELRRLGFLAYWLAFFVTPQMRPRGGELPELAFALAARLGLGERISLGPAMVSNLYADMDKVVTSAAADGVSGRVDVWAPLWLLQVWMWERYKRLSPLPLKAPQFRLQCPGIALEQEEEDDHTRGGPTVLVSCRGKAKPEWLLDYIAVISQAVLTGFHGDGMGNSVLYNPHLVARQFGYDQAAPVSIVGEFDFEGIEMWIPGIGRYGMPSEDYVAWCSGEQFDGHQVDDRHGCPVVQGHENVAGSLQLNVNKKCAVMPVLDQLTRATRREHNSCIGEKQPGQKDNGSLENEPKVIVLGLRACDKDSRTTSAKRKKEKKQSGDKFAEDGGDNKKKREPENKCEVINLVDEEEEQSASDHNMQLVLELEEFVRSGLFSQREESADEDDLSGKKRENQKKSFNDPYAEEAMREYPLFFELIPQKPHYRGFINNDEALRDLAYSGLWFLLVGLAKEVLKTSRDTQNNREAFG